MIGSGSSDTDVVFNEVDLNHNFVAIHCFLFIFESFCLFALNKHVLFEVEVISQLIHSLCLCSHLVIDFESHSMLYLNLKNACKLETQVLKKLLRIKRNISI